VRGSAADDGAAGGVRHEDVAADEPGGDAERSRRLHHQDREVAAAAAAPAQRLAGALHSLLTATEIAALVLDAARHGQQQAHRRVPALWQEAGGPRREIVRRVLPGEGAGQIGALVIGVGERKVRAPASIA
jgi:hypothetical protein